MFSLEKNKVIYTGELQERFELIKSIGDLEDSRNFANDLLKTIPNREDLTSLGIIGDIAIELTAKKNKNNKFFVLPQLRPDFGQVFHDKFQSIITETTDANLLREISYAYKDVKKIINNNQDKAITDNFCRQVRLRRIKQGFSTVGEVSVAISESDSIKELKPIIKGFAGEYSQFREENVKEKLFKKFLDVINKSDKEELEVAHKVASNEDDGFAFFSTKEQDEKIQEAIVIRRVTLQENSM